VINMWQFMRIKMLITVIMGNAGILVFMNVP